MTSANHLQQRVSAFLQGSGFVTAGPGMPGAEEGVAEIMIMSLLGAFVGLIAGFMFSRLLRFLQMFVGHPMGGYRWAIYGALLGAAVFGCIAASGDNS